jgi:hypothetical protein
MIKGLEAFDKGSVIVVVNITDKLIKPDELMSYYYCTHHGYWINSSSSSLVQRLIRSNVRNAEFNTGNSLTPIFILTLKIVQAKGWEWTTERAPNLWTLPRRIAHVKHSPPWLQRIEQEPVDHSHLCFPKKCSYTLILSIPGDTFFSRTRSCHLINTWQSTRLALFCRVARSQQSLRICHLESRTTPPPASLLPQFE